MAALQTPRDVVITTISTSHSTPLESIGSAAARKESRPRSDSDEITARPAFETQTTFSLRSILLRTQHYMKAPQPLEHPLLFPVADTSLDLQEIEDLDLVSDDENFNFEPVQIPDDPPLDSESDGPAPDSGADRQLQQTDVPSLAGSTAPDVPRFVPIEPRRSTITGTVFSASLPGAPSQ
ncbi:hypothetical protein B0H14DRAFT_2594044 [Mycena olivaceomarginata]|nr:hypothetical protein B0H14DRAFT_2594044 [Mycena olivaceomarginata]